MPHYLEQNLNLNLNLNYQSQMINRNSFYGCYEYLNNYDKYINYMRVIKIDNNDAGITTFYEEDDNYVVGLIIVHPDYQNRGIATNIINEYIKIAKEENIVSQQLWKDKIPAYINIVDLIILKCYN